jgi:hypothetical protein
MGGVDRADQYCGCYGFTRRSYRWWKKLFFWLMEVADVNSYIVYSLDKKESGETLQTHLSYEKSHHSTCGQCEEQIFKKEGKTIIF